MPPGIYYVFLYSYGSSNFGWKPCVPLEIEWESFGLEELSCHSSSLLIYILALWIRSHLPYHGTTVTPLQKATRGKASSGLMYVDPKYKIRSTIKLIPFS